MAASTIPNSGGPGSSIELSPVTIAVRDKVIEKFGDQPLDEMNESVKQLLSKEEDEQKRLGILAARVYILRQRISKIAEGDPDRVVGSAAPKASDLVAAEPDDTAGETVSSEWTRLRILEDCEVNGVRFPKTVIIDVKSVDAERLIASGNAELVETAAAPAVAPDAAADPEEDGPATDNAATDNAAIDNAAEEADAPQQAETAQAQETDEATEAAVEAPADSDEDLSALSDALNDAPAPQAEIDDATAMSTSDQDAGREAVIDAPSAEEVTAALEALSGGEGKDDAAAPAPAIADIAAPQDNADDAADVAAELEALSAAFTSDDTTASSPPEDDGADSQAADVAAELEAAAAAMAAGPSNPDTTDLPPAGGEGEDVDDENSGKPAGWFEAQQNAEQSKRSEGKSADEET